MVNCQMAITLRLAEMGKPYDKICNVSSAFPGQNPPEKKNVEEVLVTMFPMFSINVPQGSTSS